MMTENTIQEGKTLAIIGYITIIGAIIAFFLNNDKKNEFAAFHIRQGFGLCLAYMIFGFVTASFDSWLISTSFWVFFGILFIYGIASAISGKTQEVPLFGAFFQKIFANIGK
ncbi:hypothetical protein ACFS5M_08300 [Lacinutrix iliipiscaria]|uniref:Chloroplast import component protein (Tic20) n=1 Tax=Lacinutrix iliipiscaria TaxID=1230532 RepID=A0ABW5WN41_9FLAO